MTRKQGPAMTVARARAMRKQGQVLHDGTVCAQLGFRGAPERRPGERHPRSSDVFAYDAKYAESIGCGFSLHDSLTYAAETGRKA